MSVRASTGASLELLRRHVGNRADERAFRAERGAGRLIVERRMRSSPLVALAQLGEPEVEQLDARLGEHHVARLDVAVGDAFAVRARERLRQGGRVLERLVERQRAPRAAGAPSVSPSRYSMTRNSSAVLLADVVERADVRMVEPRDGPGLALEALAPVGLRRRRPEAAP